MALPLFGAVFESSSQSIALRPRHFQESRQLLTNWRLRKPGIHQRNHAFLIHYTFKYAGLHRCVYEEKSCFCLCILMYTGICVYGCMQCCTALHWTGLHCSACLYVCMDACVHVFFCMYLSMYVRTSTRMHALHYTHTHMRMHGKEDTCIDLPNV